MTTNVKVITSGEDNRVPLFCPVCNYVMNTFQDVLAFHENECCRTCQYQWGTQADYKHPETLVGLKEYLEKRREKSKVLPLLRFE